MQNYIINKGNMWHIVSRATGKTLGFASTYALAVAKLDSVRGC